MPVMFPLPKRVRSFQGPHSTCMMTAESYIKRYSRKANDTSFDFFMHRALIFSHLRFIIYFSSGLFTMAAFLILGTTFLLFYMAIHLFFRFQYKLTILLLLLRRRRIDFNTLNNAIIYTLHMTLLFIGGFGWIFMLFIET